MGRGSGLEIKGLYAKDEYRKNILIYFLKQNHCYKTKRGIQKKNRYTLGRPLGLGTMRFVQIDALSQVSLKCVNLHETHCT